MYSFNIVLTELCNACCTHCYMSVDSKKKRKTLSKEDINIIIKKIPEKTNIIVLTGGEIFLVKDILYYTINKIKEKKENIIIGLESNGIHLYNNLDNCKNELKKLKEMGVDFIRFSDDPFHADGGVDLIKVRKLKDMETSMSPIIKFLVQDKAVPIGKAKKLSTKNISKANCMNTISTKNNPYLFINIEGDIFTCAWKCVPPIGNILKEDWNNIAKKLYLDHNQLILTGKVEEAISKVIGKDITILKTEGKKYGQCSLCIKYFERYHKL